MEIKVTVQRNHRERWAYVIDVQGHFPFVSAHRFSSAQSAREAGEADAKRCQAWMDKQQETKS